MLFLIEAHNNRKQLELLFKCLDYYENDIFVHIDAKSDGFEDLQVNNGLMYSRLYVIPSQRIYWGGYSQIDVELSLLTKAMQTDKYGRVHLISGVDLPLLSQKEMHDFFEKYAHTEFVHYDYENKSSIYSKRMAQYYLLRDHIDRSQKILCAVEKASILLQKCLGVNRTKKISEKLYKGANWFSITGECAEYILSKRDWIDNIFRYTKCCDEVFLQTIIGNSKFADNRYYDEIEKRFGNLRLTDWKRGNPYIFRMKDYNELIGTNHYMFARKFDEKVDVQVIESIVDYILDEKRDEEEKQK